MADTEVDFGEMTPENVFHDRFGIRQCPTLSTRVGARTFVPTDALAPVRRLGFVLQWAYKSWPGLRNYQTRFDGRVVGVRTYSDGRIRISLDGRIVYEEKTKIVTRQGVKHQETVERMEQDVEFKEAQARQERFEAARQYMANRKKE